jgi:acyl transferase domain-containing protein/acyl carrier protein
MGESDSGASEGCEDPFEPIAVVGLGAIMPDADDAAEFWQNVIDAHVSIRDVPAGRWEVSDFWAEGTPGDVVENKTYSKIGGFVSDFEFDWKRWRVPPGTLAQIDIAQQWAVEVAAAALQDAGFIDDEGVVASEIKFPRARTGVIFANALGGENRNLSNHRVWSDRIARMAVEAGMPEDGKDGLKAAIHEGTPAVDEDTMPGELANVVAGRVANLLDLQGPNYATDAACASTFAALLDACRLLQSRQVDVMLAGASDRTMDPATFAKFSAIGALSPSHSTPFDSSANGFVMGEGAGCVVLKRLSDAISDENQIYSVIRGIGASSDGRGKGITAPSLRGQVQAVNRAYEQAGYAPAGVELIEAHGTSTIVGDATELESLGTVYETAGLANESVAVGSIKSQIGHLKAAAGIAGFLKATYALHHRTIPPSAGFSNPNQNIDWAAGPFFVPTEAADWPAPASGQPRRAGVSAFGFGGTNFHCALEQFDPEHHTELAAEWRARRSRWLGSGGIAGSGGTVREAGVRVGGSGGSAVNSGMTWYELKAVEGGILLLNAKNLEELEEAVHLAKEALFDGTPNFDVKPTGRRLSEVLPEVSKNFEAKGVRLAIVATSWADLEKRLGLFNSAVGDRAKWGFLSKQNILISDSTPLSTGDKVAHMYPGQGSQYVGMTLDLSRRYGIISEIWEEADKTMVDILDGETLSSFVLRDNLSKREMVEAEELLKQTEYTQPAMLTADLAIERLLNQHGVNPDMVAGHSLGEYAALMVSGILGFHDALTAAAARGTEMGSVEVVDCGIMASITAPYASVEAGLEQVEGYVIAANKNSPMMTVIAGETEPMKQAMQMFEDAGATVIRLQTSHAFHSRIVAPANEPLRRFLDGLEISLPDIPVTANVDGSFYPDSVEDGEDEKAAILRKLAPQMSSAVQWTTQVQTMHDAGARFFLEVGPKRALALFADQILGDEEHIVSITNHPKAGGVQSFLAALAELAVAGKIPDIHSLDSSIHTAAFRAGPMEQSEAGQEGQSNVEYLEPVTANSAEQEALRIRARPLPTAGVGPADGGSEARSVESTATPMVTSAAVAAQTAGSVDARRERRVSELVSSVVAATSGYPKLALVGAITLSQALGLDGAAQDKIRREIRAAARINPAVDESEISTVGELMDWVVDTNAGDAAERQLASGFATSIHSSVNSTDSAASLLAAQTTSAPVVSGVSLGLPGMEEVFAPDALDRILAGQNFITEIPDSLKQRLLDLKIVRLVKSEDGTARFVAANTLDKIPQLAGRGGLFDLVEQYGIDAKLVAAFDVATSLSFAAGLEALRDAGLPLLPVEQVNSAGKRMVRGWRLADGERDRTGVIFASVFPGLQMAVKHALNDGRSEEGHFDRKYLLQVLSMGHSQFAAWIGARGPNLAINNACASTPAAFAVAEDWMAAGRCDRVIIISGDDSTGDELMPWVGAGFAAAGAHAMGNVVEDVALPFDARRHGMLLGMGGAAFVLERPRDSESRGVIPYVEVLGCEIANSAFHPTRLDTEHAVSVMERFIARMELRWGINRADLIDQMTFMSHEPYTPPRGGSAAAEVESLRHVFGSGAERILITNAKGFVGHPMGVGLEDAVVIRGLAAGILPPIANHAEVDQTLGNLNLSKGGVHDLEYALRHGAGFGSQIGLTFMKRIARSGTHRFHLEKIRNWTAAAAGGEIELRILDRKLVAWVDVDENLIGGIQGDEWSPDAAPQSEYGEKDEVLEVVEQSSEIIDDNSADTMVESVVESVVDSEAESVLPKVSSASSVSSGEIHDAVIEAVAAATGYPEEFLELDADMEGELGIDSIKQAEIMGELRERFGLPIDEDFQMRDYPTLQHIIGYLGSFGSLSTDASEYGTEGMELESDLESDSEIEAETSQDISDSAEMEVMSKDDDLSAGIGEDEGAIVTPETIREGVIEVVCKHTGYPPEFLELDADMEGELGIDSIKQAEIMGDLRDMFGIPVDESFQLREYPSIGHVIGYIASFDGAENPSDTTSTPFTSEGVSAAVVDVDVDVAVSQHSGSGSGTGAGDSDVSVETAVDSDPAKPNDDSEQELARTTESGSPKVGDLAIDGGIKRYQVEVEEAPLGVSEPLDLQNSFIIVTDDAWGVAEHLCELLEARGIDAVRLLFDASVSGDIIVERDGDVDVIRCNPESVEQLAAVSNHVAGLGEVGGIIHLAPLRLTGVSWQMESMAAHLQYSVTGLFTLLQGVDSTLRTREAALVASVSALDGRHGVQSDRFNSLAAGAHGIVKSYSRERPGIRCRAIDIDPQLLADTELISEMLLAELLEQNEPREIGIEQDGSRWRLCLYDEQLEPPRVPLTSDDIWVVSGGAAGVTSECVIATAEASRDASALFVLLGRTEMVAEHGALADVAEDELAEAKKELRQNMQDEADAAALAVVATSTGTEADSDGAGVKPAKVTLVAWEREWQKIQRGIDIHRTLRRIVATGNRVVYRAVDVTDVEAVSVVVSDVREKVGPITGIIHGAGIEDSTRFEEKPIETVERVLAVKVGGWKALIDSTSNDSAHLKFVCVFTSIAGRTGNAMQADYCAANQILDVEMARISASSDDIRAVAIAWSPWAEVGMATRGSLERIFEAAGIEMIPLTEGAERFVDEALRGGKRMTVIGGAFGDLDDEDATRAPPQRLPADVAARMADPSRFPFIGMIQEIDPYDDLVAECLLTTERFPFLNDHAIDGVPYMPGVMCLEMFAECGLLLWPICSLVGFESVEFGLPVKLLKESQSIRVRAKFVEQDAHHVWVECVMETDLISSKGEIFGQPKLHHKALVKLMKMGAEITQLHPILGWPSEGAPLHSPEFVYQRMFHGPRFQVHGGVIHAFDQQGMRGCDGIALSREQLPERDQFAAESVGESVLVEATPMLIEAVFQNAGLIAMEVDRLESLPIAIDKVLIERTPKPDEALRVRTIRRGADDGITIHDGIIYDEDGEPVLSLIGLKLKGMAPLKESLQFLLSGD